MTTRSSVLVVEDDDGIRDFVSMVLEDEGYQVFTAQDGAVALRCVECQKPDIILLDMRMPVMDGWTFARHYGQQPQPHAPVIVMTAAADAQARCRDIHAAACLSKPFDIDDLISLVARHDAKEDREHQ